MTISLQKCLQGNCSTHATNAAQAQWLQAKGWKNQGPTFPRLRAGECWVDPEGHLWTYREALARLAQQQAIQLLKARGWSISWNENPASREPASVLEPVECFAPTSTPQTAFDPDNQALCLRDALERERIDLVYGEVVRTET